MDAIFAQVDYWHWLVLGGVLLLVEVLAPSFFFLWMAIAAVITGIVLWAKPDTGWQYQLLLFSVLSVTSIVLFRRFQRNRPPVTDQPALNRRGEQYVGRSFTLEQPISNNVGMLRVDDSTWRITGDDLPAGTRVTITGVNGTVLVVRKSQP